MADCHNVFWDEDGCAHTDCLYSECFPRILWDTLRIFHYPDPPRYKGRQFSEDGVQKSRVTMTIPQHPTLEWPPIEIEVVGYRFVDAFETAALKAITTFCEHHPDESVETHRRAATGNTKSREVTGALAGTAPSSTARNSVTRPEIP